MVPLDKLNGLRKRLRMKHKGAVPIRRKEMWKSSSPMRRIVLSGRLGLLKTFIKITGRDGLVRELSCALPSQSSSAQCSICILLHLFVTWQWRQPCQFLILQQQFLDLVRTLRLLLALGYNSTGTSTNKL